jgi:WGR domain
MKTKPSENFKLSGLNGMYQLQGNRLDPWEFMGSDHNSGTLFYGKKSDVQTVMPAILTTISKEAHTYNTQKLEEGGGVNTAQWDFPDGNSIIIMYADDGYFPLNKSKFKNIVAMSFGAQADDICGQEIMAGYVNFALKGVTPLLDEDDEEYLNEYFEECLTVNNKFPSKKYQDLVLDAGYKLFCEILNWNTTKLDDNEFMEKIAKKLEKNFIISQITAPIDTQSTRLVVQEENSNKEYNISFIKEKKNYTVEVAYGRIGKPLSTSTKIQTTDLLEAQESYLKTVKDKLARGYDFPNTPATTLKKGK